MSNRIFVMTERLLNRRITKGSKKSCQTCRIKIKVGDSVVTRIGSIKNKPIRHESCAIRVGVL